MVVSGFSAGVQSAAKSVSRLASDSRTVARLMVETILLRLQGREGTLQFTSNHLYDAVGIQPGISRHCRPHAPRHSRPAGPRRAQRQGAYGPLPDDAAGGVAAPARALRRQPGAVAPGAPRKSL